MAWDKTKPVTNSDLLSAEIRANWDALDLALMAPLAAGPVRSLYVVSAGGVLVPAGWIADTSSHLLPGADNVRDIGSASARPRTLNVATSYVLGLLAGGYLLTDWESVNVARISSDKVIRITQPSTGLAGFTFNFGTVHSHYNWVLGVETYPDTGLGILFLSEPVSPITTPAVGMVGLYGTDIAGAGTKGLVVRTEDGFIHRIGKGYQYPALAVVPGTPPSGFVVVYVKSSDKRLYQKDDTGLETFVAGGFANPMTTVGDLIVGGASGAATRLADVATGSVFASGGVGVAPAWSTSPTLTSLTLTARLVQARVTVTYSASMTFDASLATQFIITATNATAFTINAPTNPVLGQEIFVRIRNTSGGALGAATWNAIFKLATWTQPATAFSRAIHFAYDGSNWVETARTPADVPN